MRKLREGELRLVRTLLASNPDLYERYGGAELERLDVEEMDDGGMGSLRFVTSHSRFSRFGKALVAGTFSDTDGVPVRAALHVDQAGALMELELWKVDFSPLQTLPSASDVKIEPT